MENIGLGLELMVVGVVTVFIILMIIIQIGKWLIAAVNRWAPEAAETHRQPATQAAIPIDMQTMAIIKEAVKQITGGKGTVKAVKRCR